MTSSSSPLSRRRMALVGSAAVALLAVLIPVFRLQNLSWGHAVAAGVLFVAPCVLLASAVWRVLMRHTDPKPLGRALARHAVTAVAFSLSWTIVFSGLVYLLVRPESLAAFVRRGALWQFIWGLVIYGGIAQAARAQQRLHEQELAAASAELQALRAQLNPHFLFNTLHSLTQLAARIPSPPRTRSSDSVAHALCPRGRSRCGRRRAARGRDGLRAPLPRGGAPAPRRPTPGRREPRPRGPRARRPAPPATAARRERRAPRAGAAPRRRHDPPDRPGAGWRARRRGRG